MPLRSITRPCLSCAAALAATTLLPAPAAAAPSVWVIDDGEKIRADATDTTFERGQDDPVWRPGDPVRLFAMRNESVALQVVVEADGVRADGLSDVAVDLDALDGTGDAAGARVVNPPGSERRDRSVGLPIERFVEYVVPVRRPSGSPANAADSEGWEAGSGPDAKAWVGPVPDALIPVESAPPWAPYPMHVAPGTNAVVWIDLNVPREQAAGPYRGAIRVRAGAGVIATIPVDLEVVDALLPDRTVAVAAGYDAQAMQALGSSTETQLWQLLHAHRIAPLHDAVRAEDVGRQREALDGSLYTAGRHYAGPAPGLGDGVLAIGAGGAFGSPDDRSLAQIAAIAEAASSLHLFGGTDVLLDAAEEACGSSWGPGWRRLLDGSADASVRRVRVGWTCTLDPSEQPVDVPMLRAAWDPGRVRAARDEGKTPWVYGGVLPRTGTFLLDADAVSPRVNGWLSAMYGIPRWVVPQIAAWTGVQGGEPTDPFADAETAAPGPSGGWSNGGGVLVYPGSQTGDRAEHSAYLPGVLPSIRLKNWRRGIEDAGYLQLARDRDPSRADAIARWLIPAAFGEAEGGRPATWSRRGKPFFEARRALLAVILDRAPVALETAPASRASLPATTLGCSHGVGGAGGGVAAIVVGGAALVVRGRRRSRAAAAASRG